MSISAGRGGSLKALLLASMFLAGMLLVAVSPPAARAEAWVKTDMGAPPGDQARLFGVAVGDGDRDGQGEVYFAARQSGGVYQYTYNATSGGWDILGIGGEAIFADTVAVGDGDDTGNIEVYVTGLVRSMPRPSRMALYQIYHDAVGWDRVTIATLNTEATGNGLVIGDGNNDSRTEVFSAGSDGHIYMYYKSNAWNSQDIGSATPPPNQGSTPMSGLAVGDGDNDGYKEVYGSAGTGWVYKFSFNGQSWVRTDVGRGDVNQFESTMASIAIGDVDGDGKKEVYGASWANATIYMFKHNATSALWERTALVSLGTKVQALSVSIGDGDSDGSDELYAGTSNNQIYEVSLDKASGKWVYSPVGSGNGPMNGVTVGSAMQQADQKEVYAACGDGHGYQFLVDRTPPANPKVWSDTHPVPGTWYSNPVVHVLWEDAAKDVSGIDGYSLYWDSDPNTVPDETKEVEESVHDATSQALSPGKWFFHIRTRDNSLNWNKSATVFGPICIGTAPDTTPPSLSNIHVFGITDTLAVVSWDTNEPADAMVEYGTSSNYGLRVQEANFTLAHSVTLVGLSPSTAYHFRVLSKDQSGNGPSVSGDFSFQTLAAPDKTPPVISNVKFTGVTDRVAVITWETDEPADSAAHYGISTAYGLSAVSAELVQLHELTLTGLNASTTYHFRVLSKDGTGNGPAVSGDFTFVTQMAPDRTPPVLSNIRVAGFNESMATIQWETDEVADSYVEYGLNASYGQSSADRAFTFQHTMVLQGLLPDRTYHYRAISSDPSRNTGNGPDFTFKTAKAGGPPDTAPPVISGLSVSGISNTMAVIIWTTDEPANGEVEYGNSTAYGSKVRQSAYVAAHSVLLEGLSPSTEYHVRVSSTDLSGNGPARSGDLMFSTTATPDQTAPVITGIVVTNITNTSATIVWYTNEPASSVVDLGTTVQYGRHLSSQYFVLQHTMLITDLQPGTVYHFKVTSADPTRNTAPFSADQIFKTFSGGGTGGGGGVEAAFPWPWVLIAIILVVGILAGFAVFRRTMRRARPLPPAPRGPPGPPVISAQARQEAFEEEVEVVHMEETAKPAPDGFEDLGVSRAYGQLAATAAHAAPKAQPAAPLPMPRTPMRHIRCPACRARIPIFQDGPQLITCPNCNRSAPYRPKAVGTAAPMALDGGSLGAAAVLAAARSRPGQPARPSGGPSDQAEGAPLLRTKCPNCGTMVPIYTDAYPIKVTCPTCGKSGLYRGPKGRAG